jgi:hypothetical protein
MNTAEVLEQLSVAVRRDAARHSRRQRLAVAAAMLAIFVVGGVGIAGTYDDWWTNNAPAVQPSQLGEVAQENKSVGIDLDLSKKATVARTDDAALDAVSTNNGNGYCMSLFLGAKHMGSSCTTVSDSEYRSRADDAHWIGYGRILDANATALDLAGAGLASHVPLERGGFFVFDIPRDEWAGLDRRVGGISILAADGSTIRRACISLGVAPPSPYAGGGALGDAPGECSALRPLVPDPVYAQAQRLVSLTLQHDHLPSFAAGDTISMWRAPNRDGGLCWLVGATPSERTLTGCAWTEQRIVGGQLPLSAENGIVSGWAPAASGIVGITVDGAAATLANGVFLAEAGPGPVEVVGYDATGKEVASTKLPGSRTGR